MKRLVWVLLAALCITLVQAQPIDGLPAKAKACACKCCKIPGSCGMPGCCPASAPAPTAALNPTETARAVNLPISGKTQPSRAAAEKFYTSFVEPAAVRPALSATAEAARGAASVPLFKAHCSLLI